MFPTGKAYMEQQQLWCMTGDFGDMYLSDTWCHVAEESKCVVEGQSHEDILSPKLPISQYR